MAWSNVANGAAAIGTTSVSPTFGQATTAGNLLVAHAAASAATAAISISGAGWLTAVNTFSGGAGNGQAIFYKPSCAASEAAPTFSCSGATNLGAALSEWSGSIFGDSTILDQATSAGTSGSAFTVTCPAQDRSRSNLMVASFGIQGTKNATLTVARSWTPTETNIAVAGNTGTKTLWHFIADAATINDGTGGSSADQYSITITFSTGSGGSSGGAIATFVLQNAATIRDDDSFTAPYTVSVAVARSSVF